MARMQIFKPSFNPSKHCTMSVQCCKEALKFLACAFNACVLYKYKKQTGHTAGDSRSETTAPHGTPTTTQLFTAEQTSHPRAHQTVTDTIHVRLTGRHEELEKPMDWSGQ